MANAVGEGNGKRYKVLAAAHNQLRQVPGGGPRDTEVERFTKGQIVEDVPQADVDRLSRWKILQEVDADGNPVAEPEPEAEAPVEPVIPEQEGVNKDTPEDADEADESDEADEDETGDKYDAMSYPELQAEAKGREINAGGSADDIKARLREADEDDA